MKEKLFHNIQEAAEILGISEKVIMAWEKGFKLNIPRTNCCRIFDKKLIETLKKIKELKDKGYTSRDIMNVLNLVSCENDPQNCID